MTFSLIRLPPGSRPAAFPSATWVGDRPQRPARLLDQHPWPRARSFIDEVWFLAPGDNIRQLDSDQNNAELIESTTAKADLIVRTSQQTSAPNVRRAFP
jgi:hypothetical protein